MTEIYDISKRKYRVINSNDIHEIVEINTTKRYAMKKTKEEIEKAILQLELGKYVIKLIEWYEEKNYYYLIFQ